MLVFESGAGRGIEIDVMKRRQKFALEFLKLAWHCEERLMNARIRVSEVSEVSESGWLERDCENARDREMIHFRLPSSSKPISLYRERRDENPLCLLRLEAYLHSLHVFSIHLPCVDLCLSYSHKIVKRISCPYEVAQMLDVVKVN